MRAVGRAGFVAGTAAVLLAGVSGTASAGGGFVANENGSSVLVDASYTRDGVTGYVSAWQQQKGAGYLMLFEQSGGWVECAGGDDSGAFVGTFTYGEGTATVKTAPRYGTGSATGTVDAYREVVDGCAGTSTVTYVGPLPVSLDLAATGAVTTTRSRTGYHTPAELNEHYALSFTGRSATGTAEVAGVPSGAEGVVGKTSWSYHSN